MIEMFWLGIAVKLTASAAIVVIASIIAETTGPRGAGLIATLPITAGPSYVVLALDHDAHFIAETALTSLTCLSAIAFFMLSYCWFARFQLGMPVSLLGGIAVWAGVALTLRGVHIPLVYALPLTSSAYVLGRLTTPRVQTFLLRATSIRRWWDVPMRAGLVAALVGVVLIVGRYLGPKYAGLVTAFPLTMVCLVIIIHPRLGWQVSVKMLSHSFLGMIGFCGAIATIAFCAQSLGLPLSYLLALAVNVIWSFALAAAAPKLRFKPAPIVETGSDC